MIFLLLSETLYYQIGTYDGSWAEFPDPPAGTYTANVPGGTPSDLCQWMGYSSGYGFGRKIALNFTSCEVGHVYKIVFYWHSNSGNNPTFNFEVISGSAFILPSSRSYTFSSAGAQVSNVVFKAQTSSLTILVDHNYTSGTYCAYLDAIYIYDLGERVYQDYVFNATEFSFEENVEIENGFLVLSNRKKKIPVSAAIDFGPNPTIWGTTADGLINSNYQEVGWAVAGPSEDSPQKVRFLFPERATVSEIMFVGYYQVPYDYPSYKPKDIVLHFRRNGLDEDIYTYSTELPTVWLPKTASIPSQHYILKLPVEVSADYVDLEILSTSDSTKQIILSEVEFYQCLPERYNFGQVEISDVPLLGVRFSEAELQGNFSADQVSLWWSLDGKEWNEVPIGPDGKGGMKVFFKGRPTGIKLRLTMSGDGTSTPKLEKVRIYYDMDPVYDVLPPSSLEVVRFSDGTACFEWVPGGSECGVDLYRLMGYNGTDWVHLGDFTPNNSDDVFTASVANVTLPSDALFKVELKDSMGYILTASEEVYPYWYIRAGTSFRWDDGAFYAYFPQGTFTGDVQVKIEKQGGDYSVSFKGDALLLMRDGFYVGFYSGDAVYVKEGTYWRKLPSYRIEGAPGVATFVNFSGVFSSSAKGESLAVSKFSAVTLNGNSLREALYIEVPKAGSVTVKIFTPAGKLVSIPVSGVYSDKGVLKVFPTDSSGRLLRSGVYIYAVYVDGDLVYKGGFVLAK